MAGSEEIEAFIGITGANRTAAERMMELCGSDLEQAVQLWFADEDLQRTLTNAGSSTAPAAAGPSTASRQTSSGPSRPSRRHVGREDAQGVIHIDSDDDVAMTEDEAFGQFDEADDASEAANVARRAQEDEDAAMAKRIQEELYSSGPAGEGDVRAPLARTTETLVGPSYGGEDDGHSVVLEQLRRQQQTRGELAI